MNGSLLYLRKKRAIPNLLPVGRDTNQGVSQCGVSLLPTIEEVTIWYAIKKIAIAFNNSY